ncbi:hypothetical protein SeMB42_g03921 [Synchytrium endobioticum]|uniref:CCHC-type domain-containing protein n=1 Tax=Synchytrium endobioticum TaxID=286115 RepID=A0A507D2S1_9FUNG|nr:hypothetical protein SeMB42_g03921 [Synchytrium endobioticum]
MLVRQNVVEMVQGQLNVQWTAYQMMEHLSAPYGDTAAVNFAVKREEFHNFTITENDDPTDVVAKIQKMYQDMEEICRTKDITTIQKLLQVQCNLTIIRNLDISPYSSLRDQLITGDIVNLSLETIRNQMVNLKMIQGANGSQSTAMMGVKQTKKSIYLRTTTPTTSTPTLCYKCWEQGHYITNCTNPNQAFPGFKNQMNDGNIGKARVLVCTKCWTSGHISKNCTKDPKPFPGMNKVQE